MSSKLAVIFPGIGYHVDKPLLYYGRMMARDKGYETVNVLYKNFPDKVMGSKEKMEQSFDIAMEQTEEILKGIDFSAYEDIIFISKSIGTAVAVRYAEKHDLTVKHILFTPLEETFTGIDVSKIKAVVFHGTSDPWTDTERLKELTDTDKITLYILKDTNHSLESGNNDKDMVNLRKVIRLADIFI